MSLSAWWLYYVLQGCVRSTVWRSLSPQAAVWSSRRRSLGWEGNRIFARCSTFIKVKPSCFGFSIAFSAFTWYWLATGIALRDTQCPQSCQEIFWKYTAKWSGLRHFLIFYFRNNLFCFQIGFNLLGFTFLVPAHPGGPGHIPDEQ